MLSLSKHDATHHGCRATHSAFAKLRLTLVGEAPNRLVVPRQQQ
jgi:hypothetical protein